MMESDLLEDNFPEYFDSEVITDSNGRYILNIFSSNGDLEDVVVGLDNIRKYINESNNRIRTKKRKRNN